MVRNVNSGGGALVAKLCPSFAIPCTVACQVPLSMGFPRQGYWSGLPFPPLGGRFFFFKSLRHCKETCFFLNAKRNDWVFLNGRVASLTAKKLLCGEKLSKRMPEDFIFKGVSSREKNYCK